MIAPRILKIDLEIIDIEVGTRHLEIYILVLHWVKKILVLQVPTLTSIISAISESISKILVAKM